MQNHHRSFDTARRVFVLAFDLMLVNGAVNVANNGNQTLTSTQTTHHQVADLAGSHGAEMHKI